MLYMLEEPLPWGRFLDVSSWVFWELSLEMCLLEASIVKREHDWVFGSNA